MRREGNGTLEIDGRNLVRRASRLIRRSVERSSKLLRSASTLLASLLLLGILLACVHHHDSAEDGDRCALCSLVHVAVITPPRVDPPRARFLESSTVPLTPVLPVTSEERYTAPPRAPPLS